ncbi:protein kinase domain-containing protein [Streptomyces fulvoviolaceus]|uniref:serine/threonine-protein kinase n=1 Tax=Streptomyces fulvoviolaceus TaxID=285535 RepID=UPI0021BF070E|nr:serine/threonine-protein kinase [Streptomyces fulvoviolaceus]MCT9077821.1 serine/threonine-protein kinase [Streptomyces fulvoviolaceus]
MQELRETDPRTIGPYEVLGRLGSGGMGEVYLAEARGGPRLAVKVVRAEHAEDRTFRARFRHEVRAAQTVGGAGTYTARVVDADTEAGRPWMATEFVAGPNLRDAVLDGGPMTSGALRLLAAALAEALAAIHAKGLVHRDLKPSNILLAADGPRVIDFGIVRALEGTALTRTGVVVGSVGYVSPEQIRNGAHVGPASDVFSLGAVLAYAAGGKEPFGEGQDSVVLLRILTGDVDLSAVPKEHLPLVESCLRDDPGARPTPADVVAAAGHTVPSLREGLRAGWYAPGAPEGPESAGGGERWMPDHDSGERQSGVEYVAPMTVTDVPAVTHVPQAPAPPSRRRLLRALAGGAGVVAAGGVGGWLWLRDSSEDPSTREGPAAGGQASTGSPSGTPGVGWQYKVQGLGGRRGPCAALSPDGTRVYVGGTDGSLHALDLNGQTVWRTALGAEAMSPLATAHGVYCLLEDDQEGGSKLCALGRGGKVRWTRTFAANSQFPVAAGELILVSYGDGSGAGGVRAYASDGSVRWSTPTGAAPTGEPTVADGVVYVGTFGDRVQALDAKSGRRLWATPAGLDTGRPALVGDTLMVGSGGEEMLHGISRTGKALWDSNNEQVYGSRYFTCVPFGGLGVAATDYELVALDPADGSTVWTFQFTDEGSQYSDPTVSGDTVYVRRGSTLYGLNRKGKQTWQKRVEGGASIGTQRPVVRGGRVYVATADGITVLGLKP